MLASIRPGLRLESTARQVTLDVVSNIPTVALHKNVRSNTKHAWPRREFSSARRVQPAGNSRCELAGLV